MTDFDFIDEYNQLRDLCEKLADADDGKLMGDDAWLRHAMSARDITLAEAGDAINCSGFTYSSQTMDHEWFDFDIPKSDIRLAQLKQLLSHNGNVS